MLKPGGQVEGDAALEFYAKHTAQIEVTRGQVPPRACAGAHVCARYRLHRKML